MIADSAFAFKLPKSSSGWIACADAESGKMRMFSRRQLRDAAKKIEEWQTAGLNRASLEHIAEAGGTGKPFYIGERSEDDIADRIISSVKRGGAHRAKSDVEEHYEDVYWFFLLAAGICLMAGLLTLI